MKLNERSVVHYATCGIPPDKSGFLMKKSERSGTFHRRWCVLKANMLFLFEERGRREPLGLVVLEGCTVELCESERVDFAFAVRFGQSHTHTLAADTQEEMEDWAKALARASFQYLRLVVRELEKQLEEAQKKSEDGAAGGVGEITALHPDPTRRENGISWNEPSQPEDLRILGRENSASWNKPMVANGVAWEGECGVRGRPPPIPPRRKSPPEMGVAHGDMGVSPGTTCFSKLHEWYGKEVAQIRREWLQSQ
ncbi:sesquipedalian-1 [Tachysurus vachellii]|uniref:sesquipedalian-1 n=1 Tax=Tachysurus vachellii TaxID=175792 RepID=UPI00296B1872|nr:sesquipedalian-1 [Tachysurus vachellii]XP_060739972.1 sesquipedalian-1 [Tachysurus vachellii]XP_060739973.1 sesquipedalian-1 [Tachysurus vachellii]XP_060739974.1 sesquipedalian-1 [Tachysurus vachellii]